MPEEWYDRDSEALDQLMRTLDCRRAMLREALVEEFRIGETGRRSPNRLLEKEATEDKVNSGGLILCTENTRQELSGHS